MMFFIKLVFSFKWKNCRKKNSGGWKIHKMILEMPNNPMLVVLFIHNTSQFHNIEPLWRMEILCAWVKYNAKGFHSSSSSLLFTISAHRYSTSRSIYGWKSHSTVHIHFNTIVEYLLWDAPKWIFVCDVLLLYNWLNFHRVCMLFLG